MKTERITSGQNAKVRELTPLQHRSAYRRETGLFAAEGRREVARCLDAGYVPRTFFYCPEIIGKDELSEIFAKVPKRLTNSRRQGASDGPAQTEDEVMAVEIPAEIYDKVAYRGGTEGIIAVMHAKEHRLEDLLLGTPSVGSGFQTSDKCRDGFKGDHAPLIVVLEGVEKPGNLGAVLRSSDAAGADAVILCDSPSDLYNPNVIRASTGTVFSMPIAEASTQETIAWLKERGVRILTAQLQDSQWYYDTDMVGDSGVAIVMGTEDVGLSNAWREAADAHIRIPMLGQADSLNVSVSAAILLYEAVRQRYQKGLLH